MQTEDFISLISEISPESKNAPTVWIRWAKELAYFDSINGHRTHEGSKTPEAYLKEYADHLCSIRSMYGDGVAGQIVSLAELYSCPMPWEMEGAARFLAAGGELDEVLAMEYAGTLEDYMPTSTPVLA